MNVRLARLLTRVYPRAWRERYGAEFTALLESSRGSLRTFANVVCCAMRERLCTTGGHGMETSQLTVWCERTPWLMFAVLPLLFLAGAYFVAGFILWSGWQIFLPDSQTPFVPIDGSAIVYFGVGRSLYFAAPVLIGWGIALMAARQRMKVFWPSVGMVLMAFIGSAAQVHASRADTRSVGDVSFDIGVGGSLQTLSYQLLHASIILVFAVAPYLLLRYRNRRPLSA